MRSVCQKNPRRAPAALPDTLLTAWWRLGTEPSSACARRAVNFEFKLNFPSGQGAARAFSRGGRRFATLLPLLGRSGQLAQTGPLVHTGRTSVAVFGFASLWRANRRHGV